MEMIDREADGSDSLEVIKKIKIKNNLIIIYKRDSCSCIVLQEV